MEPIRFIPRGTRRGPITGAERMRDFRRRHPEYDRACKAKQREARKAYQASLAAMQAPAKVETPALPVQLAAPARLALPAPPVRLALPAPVVDPVLLAINEMVAARSRATIDDRVPVSVLRTASLPSSTGR